MSESKKRQKYTSAILIFLAIVGVFFVGWKYYQISKENDDNLKIFQEQIITLQEENLELRKYLKNEKDKNESFAATIGEIAGTVSKLDKLSKTDRELLQKYSKIYFLNENYVPENLINITPDYIYEKDKKLEIHTKAYPYLQEMIVTAAKNGIDLKLISAYRSFGEQSSLKNTYLVTYGSGANKFSADQGYSEHQLGTAIDFTTPELGLNFTNFKTTDAYEWLLDNAYKFGFVISYPENNGYYQFEPWHWRFVGKSLANMLHQEDKHFYDLDQRTIDNYLINIFD